MNLINNLSFRNKNYVATGVCGLISKRADCGNACEKLRIIKTLNINDDIALCLVIIKFPLMLFILSAVMRVKQKIVLPSLFKRLNWFFNITKVYMWEKQRLVSLTNFNIYHSTRNLWFQYPINFILWNLFSDRNEKRWKL